MLHLLVRHSWMQSNHIITYRTVLAESSIGAPESVAAARTSPASLPLYTCLGIGENVLLIH